MLPFSFSHLPFDIICILLDLYDSRFNLAKGRSNASKFRKRDARNAVIANLHLRQHITHHPTEDLSSLIIYIPWRKFTTINGAGSSTSSSNRLRSNKRKRFIVRSMIMLEISRHHNTQNHRDHLRFVRCSQEIYDTTISDDNIYQKCLREEGTSDPNSEMVSHFYYDSICSSNNVRR